MIQEEKKRRKNGKYKGKGEKRRRKSKRRKHVYVVDMSEMLKIAVRPWQCNAFANFE